MMSRLFPLLLLFCFSCSAQQKDETYDELKARVSTERERIHEAYKQGDSLQRDSLITVSRDYLFRTITTDFFDHWYGTEWDFNGTTRMPKQGKIACGYFITTVLSDAGLNIPRTYWAQQASEYYIKRMTTDIKRFSNQPVENVMAYFKDREDGLYIVGLDNHVGFVYKSGKQLQFVHASYYDPSIGVQSEKLNTDNPLAHSEYRVAGRILSDEMIRKWITGERCAN
jgi:hypothetical protein